MKPAGFQPVRFPWRQAIAFGLGALRLSPETFWRMTPRELAVLMQGVSADTGMPLDRAGFEALQARFPDYS